MGFLGSLTVIGFAIFPAAVLTGFIISHFRRRLGWRLAIRAIVLGAIAALIAIALSVIIGPPQRWFAPGPIRIAAQAFLGAALLEEGAKFLLLYYVVREHKDCDSGGDLFSASMLIALGFAALENVFYVLGGGEAWLSMAMMRGVLAIPGHAVFGCMMGYFAARVSVNLAQAELAAGVPGRLRRPRRLRPAAHVLGTSGRLAGRAAGGDLVSDVLAAGGHARRLGLLCHPVLPARTGGDIRRHEP
jgi:RsiW-degrading membrane proteinase PrsW (M82 family)